MPKNDKIISKHKAEIILKAAYEMTGNEDFLKIIKRIEVDQEICILSYAITKPFPIKGNDWGMYNGGKKINLEDKISELRINTKKLIELLSKWTN